MRNLLIILASVVAFTANAVGPTGSAIAPSDYVGRVLVKGDMGFDSENFKNLRNAAGALAPHSICKYRFGNDARAAEYEDFKHIISDLGSSRYWLTDAFTSKKNISGNDYRLLRKDGTMLVINDSRDGHCDNYSNDTNSYDGTVVNASTNRLESYGCELDAYIACVK